jgi:hypothetical protein
MTICVAIVSSLAPAFWDDAMLAKQRKAPAATRLRGGRGRYVPASAFRPASMIVNRVTSIDVIPGAGLSSRNSIGCLRCDPGGFDALASALACRARCRAAWRSTGGVGAIGVFIPVVCQKHKGRCTPLRLYQL